MREDGRVGSAAYDLVVIGGGPGGYVAAAYAAACRRRRSAVIVPSLFGYRAATVDLPMTGTKQSFIGKIKPGNDAPAVFMLDGGKGGTYPYNVSITYVDDLGTHTVFQQMSLRVDPGDSSGGLILLLLGVICVGAVAYRFWYLPKKNGDRAFPWVKKS
jgi:hypothetical protein